MKKTLLATNALVALAGPASANRRRTTSNTIRAGALRPRRSPLPLSPNLPSNTMR